MKPMAKSRLKRFFDFQFPSVWRNSTVASEKVVDKESHFQKDCFNGFVAVALVVATEFELCFVCLDSIVQYFIEESNNNNNNEKQSCAIRCGRNHCNCFNRNCIDSSLEDEWDSSAILTILPRHCLNSTSNLQFTNFVLFHRAYLTAAVTDL